MIPTMGKGGAEDIIISLANANSKNSFVTLFLLRRCDGDDYNLSRLSKNINVIHFEDCCNQKWLNTLKPLSSFYKIFKSFQIFFTKDFYQFDIIHSNLTLSSALASAYQFFSLLPKYNKPKYIETFHTNFHLIGFSRLVIFIIGWNLRHKLVYEINEPEKLKIKRVLLNKKKLFYIPFSAESHRELNIKPIYESSKETYKLITVSRMRVFEKKIFEMIDVLFILRNSYKLPFELILAGDGKDIDVIKQKVNDLQLKHYVEFTGFVDSPQDFMHKGDIYMCAMVGNDPGISGIQACQQRIPLIGIQTLKNYASSPIFSSNIPEQIASKINNLVTKQDLNEYAESCMTFVDKKFSVNNMINKYKDLYYDFDEESAL
jgi:glycosyltransferase involved in cell wall biosynthesis